MLTFIENKVLFFLSFSDGRKIGNVSGDMNVYNFESMGIYIMLTEGKIYSLLLEN
jgi:hypothetical protein